MGGPTEYIFGGTYHTVETPHQIWATALSGGLFGPSRTYMFLKKRRFFHAEISITLKCIKIGIKIDKCIKIGEFLYMDFRFNYMYTKMHGFKYEFSKFFCGGAYRAPSQDPLSRSISGFALDSRALCVLGSGCALNSPCKNNV